MQSANNLATTTPALMMAWPLWRLYILKSTRKSQRAAEA
jgi:hypothetical protein